MFDRCPQLAIQARTVSATVSPGLLLMFSALVKPR